MALASLSSTPAGGSALWAQVQQQQAQRSADQAEQRARALQDRASEAQSVAVRAQENARSLQVESRQAQGDASEARRGLAGLESLGAVQTQLSDLREQIGKVLEPDTATTDTLAPGVNAFGQETGAVVNVTG